ncbi:DUF6843 domain-containing protein [Spirosoma aerolatum]|uniref:DUF6843 domain-containing protein n=1 Tax=Spirosoma aerolatum TaxID=1211326 RepID=UPI0009AC501F|nr:hypothetical protein [Spirosoma aerolatum]
MLSEKIKLRKALLIGKIVVVLAFVVSLNPYVLFFTVPVFLIGTIFVWISKAKLRTKVLWTILPVLFWYPAFFLFMYLSGVIGTATAQKLDFIFEGNFEGKVLVVENMKCGQPVNVVNGREQLFIPRHGVLLYQGEIKTGYVNHKYYKITNDKQKIELPERANYMYFDSELNKPNTKVTGVWLLDTGKGTNTGGKTYKFMDLLVASKDSADKYYEFAYTKRFEQFTDSLINHCK